MRFAWRWYGPTDSIKIKDIMQVGVTDVVTALHHVKNGEIWTIFEIKKRKKEIEFLKNGSKTGLTWSTVESVPVHEDIKKRNGNYKQYIKNYIKTLENLSFCGIKIVIYNFMPVLDWTRTNVKYRLVNGSKALKYEHLAVIAFDLFILKRKNSEQTYLKEEIVAAKKYFKNLNLDEKNNLTKTILLGLPGSEESYNLEKFKEKLLEYKDIDNEKLQYNLCEFLKEIAPNANKNKIKLAIHPDDPPRNIFGLPRVVGHIKDYEEIFSKIDIFENGMTLCTGSLGVDESNDFAKIIEKFKERIHFIHLRNVKREENTKNFYEASHLEGSTDIYEVLYKLVKYEQEIKKINKNFNLYLRPDHGHQMLDDLDKIQSPGYSCIGRMKGLAEIKGIVYAIEKNILRS